MAYLRGCEYCGQTVCNRDICGDCHDVVYELATNGKPLDRDEIIRLSGNIKSDRLRHRPRPARARKETAR